MGVSERRVLIQSDGDIVVARQQGRALAEQIGFTGSDLTIIATAISEVARNIILYAGAGEIRLSPIFQGNRYGIIIMAQDYGPGISDVSLAMQDGYSTSGGLGLGLPGVRRLMDELEISSSSSTGTMVVMKKWKR